MTTVTFIHPDGSSENVSAEADQSAMQIAVANGIGEIVGECGGNAMCATCHVYVEDDWIDRLPPPGDDEDALLDGAAAERRTNSRLSCQIKLTPKLEGLVLRLPARQT